MQHQATFWRRTAQGVFDEDNAFWITSAAHVAGRRPAIYIPERYVIGMLGLRSTHHASAQRRNRDCRAGSGAAPSRAGIRCWSYCKRCRRALRRRAQAESYEPPQALDDEPAPAVGARNVRAQPGAAQSVEMREVHVASVAEFVAKDRKIVGRRLSIGVFFVDGQWHAPLHNSCLHRGGSVCKGPLENGILTCPWHGYEYKLETGELLLDPNARLPRFPVEIRDGEVYLRARVGARGGGNLLKGSLCQCRGQRLRNRLAANEFAVADVKPGQPRW